MKKDIEIRMKRSEFIAVELYLFMWLFSFLHVKLLDNLHLSVCTFFFIILAYPAIMFVEKNRNNLKTAKLIAYIFGYVYALGMLIASCIISSMTPMTNDIITIIASLESLIAACIFLYIISKGLYLYRTESPDAANEYIKSNVIWSSLLFSINIYPFMI